MLTQPVLASWLLSLMVSTVPPGTHLSARAVETREEGADRYAHIANAIATATLDPSSGSPYGEGRDGLGRARTATLLLAISYLESGWRRDVDLGITRGDGGRSCSVFQLQVGAGKTAEGWTCDELVGDREKAARAALAAVLRSAHACRGEKGPEAILFAYASGGCDGDRVAFRGLTVRDVTKLRTDRARRWWNERPLSEWMRTHPELADTEPRGVVSAGLATR